MRETDKAWVAAVIDCEGYLSIVKQQEPRVRRGFSYRAVLLISNKNRAFVEHFKVLAGGGSVYQKVEHRLEWADMWVYFGNPSCIRQLLPQILAYLIVKKLVAQKMLDFLNFVNVKFRGEYPPEIHQSYQEVRRLNRKGKSIASAANQPLQSPLVSALLPKRTKPSWSWRSIGAEDKALIAAVVDSEGSLSIRRIRERRVRRGYTYVATMQVTNKDRALLERFRHLVGGGSVCRVVEPEVKWADKWLYMTSANPLRRILPQIIPYLIIKKNVADRMIEFLSLIHTHLRGEYSSQITALYQEIRQLNRKGRVSHLLEVGN